jgi:hypothetical protein
VGTLGARIVLSDDKEARALMTASWLKQMGWNDVFVLPEAGNEMEEPAHKLLCEPQNNETIGAEQLSSLLAQEGATVIDLSTSPHYRRGHIPGAWFAIRGRLDRAVKKIHITGTCQRMVCSPTSRRDCSLTSAPIRLLKGGNPV